MNTTPIVVGIIIAITMILAGYGVFQSTVSSAEDSLFQGQGSLLDKTPNNDETEGTGLNHDKNLGEVVSISKADSSV